MELLTDIQKERLKNFVVFVIDKLGIEKAPKIIVQNGRKALKTTANYDYTKEEKVIRVNGKNRMLVDIMRSIAHELVHHKQFEDGRLDGPKPPDIGGKIEDEANAKAGQFIKMYSKMDSTLYDE